ncbi:MAG: hypothetical protein EXX96DRAFT_583390 [Benjaminiella poitrasii]|nr:MAG: hypothetical protein EXX96DRAFT_583390 [Benjaminiella poitrasii]
MQIEHLPYEILITALSYLNGKDVISFAHCNSIFYKYAQQMSFWADLCHLYGIHYCHPNTTWKSLYCSGQLSKMCPHLDHSIIYSIQRKKSLLWTSLSNLNHTVHNYNSNYVLCLHPSCDYVGESSHNLQHPITLKLSLLHSLELWCSSCVKTIGFDKSAFNNRLKLEQQQEGLRTEQYLMNEMIRTLTSYHSSKEDEQLRQAVIKGRRSIEFGLYQLQFKQQTTTMHIIDKDWYTTWLTFISGKSNQCPKPLVNKHLFRKDGSLDPTLSLGKDFELIGSLTRWYIERIYGVSDTILAASEIPNNAEYCKLIHKIRIRHQMNQVRRYPPTITVQE